MSMFLKSKVDQVQAIYINHSYRTLKTRHLPKAQGSSKNPTSILRMRHYQQCITPQLKHFYKGEHLEGTSQTK